MAAEWDISALLAIPSAIVVTGVNLVSDYRGEAGAETLRAIVRDHRGHILGLLILAGAAGVAATLIVSLIGVTKPPWLDEPGGWVLLGVIGPALADLSVGSFRYGSAELHLGLAIIYKPLRQMLLEPIDNAFYRAGRPVKQRKEAVYRQHAGRHFEEGRLSLDDLIDALREYGDRSVRTPEDKREIGEQLTSIRRGRPAGASTREWEGERLGTLVAFIVAKGYHVVLDALIGEPGQAETERIEVPEVPDDAFG